MFLVDNFVAFLLYADIMLTIGQDVKKISQLKKKLSKSFDMKKSVIHLNKNSMYHS